MGIAICYTSLIWIGLTLKSFGKSFRIGIDGNAPDKLVTSGMFALSRNPIYVAFLAFLTGMILAYPNLAACIAFALFATAIHRQVLREEKFLRGHYGNEYEDYCRRVRRYL
jgi:protein-S-isoprenylcysteine O-methyltransferase Ste14